MRFRSARVFAAVFGLLAVGVLSFGCGTETFPLEEPQGVVLYLWDSRSDGGYAIPQQATALQQVESEYSAKFRSVDLATAQEPLGEADVIWIHPSVLPNLTLERTSEIEERIGQGTPVIYMDPDESAFVETFQISTWAQASGQNGNAAPVGFGFKYVDSVNQVPHRTWIFTGNATVSDEGKFAAVNALIGASNELLESESP